MTWEVTGGVIRDLFDIKESRIYARKIDFLRGMIGGLFKNGVIIYMVHTVYCVIRTI
jgi:hypothetical protein